MSFQTFKHHIMSKMKKAGVTCPVEFEHDRDKGMYSARTCGILFTANRTSEYITSIAGTHVRMFAV